MKELSEEFNIPTYTLYNRKVGLKRKLDNTDAEVDKFDIILQTCALSELELDSWIKTAGDSSKSQKSQISNDIPVVEK